MRLTGKILFRSALGLTLLLWTAACETDGPEFADGGTTSLIEGTLQPGENTQSHLRALTRSGTVSLQLTDLEVRDAASGAPVEDYRLGVSVGLPNSDDSTICQITFSKLLGAGDSFSVYNREGLFCVVTFRPADQPPETVVRFLLTLSGAFS